MDKGAWSTGLCVRPTSRTDFRTDFRVDFRIDFRIDSRTDKHHHILFLN